jgi:hypothetical protein
VDLKFPPMFFNKLRESLPVCSAGDSARFSVSISVGQFRPLPEEFGLPLLCFPYDGKTGQNYAVLWAGICGA